MTKSQKRLFSLYGMGILIAMLIFFLRAHPLIVFDTDDWLYIYYTRPPFLLWGDWNPSRILPEVFMPLCSQLAVWLIYPFSGDYIASLSLMHGTVLSLFITGYVLAFTLFVQKKLHASFACSVTVGTLFLLMHFWIFRNADSGNAFLFAAADTTCIFYYTIPSLLNLTLIFLFESFPFLTDLHDRSRLWLKGIVIALVYFAVFSNLYSSYLLAIWAGVDFLYTGGLLLSSRKENTCTAPTLVSRILYECAIILAWFTSVVFEFSGGRADSLGERPFMESLSLTFSLAKERISNCNPVFSGFVFFTLIVFFIEILVNFVRKRSQSSTLLWFAKGVLVLTLCAVYLLLCGAKTNPFYIPRSDVQMGLHSIGFVILCGIIIHFVQAYSSKLLVPVALFLVFVCFQINTDGVTFADTSCANSSWQTCYAYSRYIVEELTRAEQEHLTDYELHVPFFNDGDNFPIGVYGSMRFGNALLCHGVLSRSINVTLIPDANINARFGF